jgi:hypothetical protein
MEEGMSNLEKHAEYELERAGFFKEDRMYGSMLGHSTMKLIKVFASEGHSGYSASIQVELFKRLASFKPLTPLTDSPEEWVEVSDKVWQNKRSSDCFSSDGGKTYYSVDDKDRAIKTSESTPTPKL